jgi:HSP20 family protein
MTFQTIVHPRYSRRPRSRQVAFAPLFEDLRRGLGADPAVGRTSGYSPQIVGRETETEYRLVAELPGCGEGDFELVVEDGVLTLSGDRPDPFAEVEAEPIAVDEDVEASEAEEASAASADASRLHFERRFRFREPIDEDGVEACYKNGLLDVTIPKVVPEAPPVRRIEVTSH